MFVFGNILHRMILWELCKVFLLALVGITGLLLMAGIIAEASQQGLGPAQILAAIPLLIPSTLPYTIPATTLFATCVVYGRMSADNEVLAIKSSGVNILKVVKPGVVLGLAMSAATLGLYYRIIPYTHALLRAMVYDDAEELLYSLLKKHQMLSHSQLPYAMYVKGVQGKKLLSPVFKHKNPHGKIDVVASAREAELRVDQARKRLYVRMHFGYFTGEDGQSPAYFRQQMWEVDLPSVKENARKPRDLTWQEILDRRRELEADKARLAAEMANRAAGDLMRGEPQLLPEHAEMLRREVEFRQQQITALDVELQMRAALSVGCLCFILIGCPVGIWFSRSDYLSSFITCFLPIVLVYYPLMLCGTNFAKEGRLNLVPLVWGADLLMGALGLALFRRLMRN